ncbi:hypothetical protein Tco_0521926 [Tanacetum coccineum]
MKSRITPNSRHQPPEQSQEGGMEVSTPEARHQSLVYSEDSDLLHQGPDRRRRVVYSIGWEEKNKAHLHVLTVVTKVPKQREPRSNQGSIITGVHYPEEPADIQRVKTAREVTGSPNQREVLDVEGAPECMEMYRVTASFLQGEVAAFSHSRKKAPAPWKQPEGGNKPNFKKGFKNKQRSDRKPYRFSFLTKT